MIRRRRHLQTVSGLLRRHPVVAILGARQVGKTTLARQVAERGRGLVTWFDLEDPADLARLSEPSLALGPLRGLVVLDEIQRRPDLFPALRVLVDHSPSSRRFLILGSASPALLRQSSESLAGRIVYHEMPGFSLDEVGARNATRLWVRGGFPRSYLASSDRESAEWRRGFLRTFLERDLPQLGITVPAATIGRFWSMLAHYHGQIWNASEFARSFGMTDLTVRRYLDLLSGTYLVRQLPPWHENLGKRQVKSPKVYLADSGLLHSLLGLETLREIEGHPKVGASWEGFVLEAAVGKVAAWREECHFWATHAGAELDLLVMRGGRRRGFEFKRTDAPTVTPSMRIAVGDLALDRLDVVHAGLSSFPMARKIYAVAMGRLLQDLPAM